MNRLRLVNNRLVATAWGGIRPDYGLRIERLDAYDQGPFLLKNGNGATVGAMELGQPHEALEAGRPLQFLEEPFKGSTARTSNEQTHPADYADDEKSLVNLRILRKAI
jgi:hypothetical protein